MVGSVQSLTNMEYMLYGNTPSFGNMAVPSMMNGYCMNSAYLNPYYANQYYNPYVNMYNGYYNNAGQDIFTQAGIQNATQNTQQNQRDIDKIADFYSKNSQPSESLAGAAIGGAAFGLVNNPRLIAHPWNSAKSLGNVEKMFSEVKVSGTELNKLWTSPKTNDLMREAYFRMHKIESRHMSKLGLFRKQLSEADYTKLKGYMDEALKSGNADEIAKATAQLEHAYVNDGPLAKAFGKVKEFFGGKAKARTVDEALSETKAINERADQLKAAVNAVDPAKGITFKDALKRGGGVKGGLFFMAIEILMSRDNIKAAFSKDNKTGMTQVGQTLVKGAGSAAGWALGEAAGVWGATKLCAAIGTAISPGLGTAIGGVLGLIGGSIGCWLAGKATKKLVGQDVGEKIKIEQMKQTPEGQYQLLTLTAQQKNIPLDVQQSIQNVAAQYSQAA